MVAPRQAVVAAAVIAGGFARRLGGVDKGAMLVGGRSILERQLAVLVPRFSRVLLVVAPEDARSAAPSSAPVPAPASAPSPSFILSSVTVVHDRGTAGRGPLAGIDAALAALHPDEEAVVCVGGDMPLLQAAVLERLRDHLPTAAAVVPSLGVPARPEPLLARYGRTCAGPVAAALHAGAFKTATLVQQLPVAWLDEATLRALDPALLSFENANTPGDLARIEAIAQTLS